MKTALFSALALSACTSVAFADSLPPAANAGPVALTEAEMDQVTAGIDPSDDFAFGSGLDDPGDSMHIEIPASKRAKFKPGNPISAEAKGS